MERALMKITDPHPIDMLVGRRIRARRNELSVTQTELAERLGVTFQQVQKYETGKNRVSCSRLSDIAKTLETPISYFFADSPGTDWSPAGPLRTGAEGRRLVTAFLKITDRKSRKDAIDLVERLASRPGRNK
jgi:transcriptional regulator with XRE-family HTH domain